MRLDQALQKIDLEVVKVDMKKGGDGRPQRLTLLLRAHKRDPLNQQRWVSAATKLVVASARAERAGTWSADVSKALLARGLTAVLFWRIILTGNVKTGQRIFGEAVLEALRSGREITSFPLVGQVQYERDPANGKFKGGHKLGTGSAVAAAHFTVR